MAFSIRPFCPVDRDERTNADWHEEPTEDDIEAQRSVIESKVEIEEMYRDEL